MADIRVADLTKGLRVILPAETTWYLPDAPEVTGRFEVPTVVQVHSLRDAYVGGPVQIVTCRGPHRAICLILNAEDTLEIAPPQ